MKSTEIRETFLSYFEHKEHKRIRSSSLVPRRDPTILFTNAGMNPFKDTFLGKETRSYSRATSCQKCLRVSGKHNDLENVGKTARHHTFFEMLGNFSFGDYFKQEAIEYAWELMAEGFGLPPSALWATVYEKDEEAAKLWQAMNVLPSDRIVPKGEKENFWAMGETGPCGPCSEILIDRGPEYGCSGKNCDIDCGCDQFVELWNLVFIQFNRSEQGQLEPLPAPSIDTGMGLERLAAILQNTKTNYETDLILPIIQATADFTGIGFGTDSSADVAYRVIADHLRAITFLVSDGVLPSNEGRGYVLRRLLRRALRFGRNLAIEEPFLHRLAGEVVSIMEEAYPELTENRSTIEQLTRNEEERFFETLKTGLEILEDRLRAFEKKGEPILPGDLAFRLYDTYGFPLELTEDIAAEREMTVDRGSFEALLEEQRERARTAWIGQEKEDITPIYQALFQEHQPEFVGYDRLQAESRVLALLKEKERVQELTQGEEGEALLAVTPFYAEAGGQVGDTGRISSDSCVVSVSDTRYPIYGLSICTLSVEEGSLAEGDEVTATVDETARRQTMANHTATHLLHAALRHLLGTHVRQSGSLVAPPKLRFDFSHFTGLTTRTLQEVEELVNENIRADLPIEISTQDFDSAVQAGAMAIFEEKYGEQVRVVTVPGFSTELCGGTHVQRTGEIGVFKILLERGVAAGVRRIEAATGHAALRISQERDQVIEQAEDRLRCRADKIAARIEEFQERLKQHEREIQRLRLKIAHQEIEKKLAEVKEFDGVRLLAEQVEKLDRAGLRNLADALIDKLKSGVVVLGTLHDNNASLVVSVSSDLIPRLKADVIINELAEVVGGKGGGRSDLAEAGGKKGTHLREALAMAEKVIRQAIRQA